VAGGGGKTAEKDSKRGESLFRKVEVPYDIYLRNFDLV
jgi:hypothetical protein